MKSKISCFNKTIFKKNFTQYWPVWIGVLLYMLAMVPLSLYQYMHSNWTNTSARQYSALRNIFANAGDPLLLFIFCVIAVMCVFSYLYTAKNANGIHALPVTRLELFVTNTLSAFTFLAAAEFISFVVGVFVGLSCGVTNIEILLYLFLFQLGLTFFGVAFASTVAMLTGHIMAMPVYCLIANYLYVIVREVLETLIINSTYGLSDLWGNDISYVLSPIYYLEQKVYAETAYNDVLGQVDGIAIHGAGAVAAYAGVGVLLFVLAYRLYRRRQLETAGDVIAVGFMKPIFRIGVGICGGTAAGMVLSEFFYFDTIRYSSERFTILLVCVIGCSVIGYLAAEMLMQKSFRVFKKRIIIEGIATVAVTVVLLLCVNADAFGLEKALPDQDEVVMAYVDMDYPVKFEGEDVAELLAIHEQIIAEKDNNLEVIKNNETTYSATFKYVLADGSVFSRNYSLPIDTENPTNPEFASGKIISMEMDTERLTQYLMGVNYDSNMYLSGGVSLYDQYQNYYEYRLSEDEMNAIVAALQKDIVQGNYAYYQLYSISGSDINSDEFMNDLNINYYNEEGIVRVEDEYYSIPEYYDDGYGYDFAVTETASSIAFTSAIDMDNLYISFGKKCSNLINTLEELGIVNDTWHLYTYDEYDLLSTNNQ